MASPKDPTHWLIRVQDGENFRNSRYPFWGVKRGCGGGIKTIVSKINSGDILWFMTSKPHGGKLIGMAEFTKYYDRADEQLIKIHTYSNKEQNWKGADDWAIQIHYTKLYITEKQNIGAIIQCGGVIMEYETFKDKGLPDLYNHYKNFIYYAEPQCCNEIYIKNTEIKNLKKVKDDEKDNLRQALNHIKLLLNLLPPGNIKKDIFNLT